MKTIFRRLTWALLPYLLLAFVSVAFAEECHRVRYTGFGVEGDWITTPGYVDGASMTAACESWLNKKFGSGAWYDMSVSSLNCQAKRTSDDTPIANHEPIEISTECAADCEATAGAVLYKSWQAMTVSPTGEEQRFYMNQGETVTDEDGCEYEIDTPNTEGFYTLDDNLNEVFATAKYVGTGQVGDGPQGDESPTSGEPPDQQTEVQPSEETTTTTPPMTEVAPDGTETTTETTTTTTTPREVVTVSSTDTTINVIEYSGGGGSVVETTTVTEYSDGVIVTQVDRQVTNTAPSTRPTISDGSGWQHGDVNGGGSTTTTTTTTTTQNPDGSTSTTTTTSSSGGPGTSGGGGDGGGGSGSGDGDCTGDDCGDEDPYNHAPRGEDDLYTPGEKTFESVLTGFTDRVSAAPAFAAVSGFFEISLPAASCPIWSAEIPIFGVITFDQQCSSAMESIWPLIYAIILATAAFVAFRWAVL